MRESAPSDSKSSVELAAGAGGFGKTLNEEEATPSPNRVGSFMRQNKLQKRYVIRGNAAVLKSVDAFCSYYHLIKRYIGEKKIRSSLDRGAFARPQFILNAELYALLGAKRNSHSYAYGPEIGDQEVRDRISNIENKKHGTKYTSTNVAMVPGAWSGVELVLEELAGLKKGRANKLTVAVVGPTHYQMFHRAINVLGVNIISFDFVNFEQGSTPRKVEEIEDILSCNPDAVFIANPNNPNGEYFPSQLLKTLIKICTRRKIYVIIDEIQDFFNAPGVGLGYGSWVQSPNVIRIDSFSKKRGLAEYRVGWVIADEKILGNRLTGVIGRMSGFMGNAPRAANTAMLRLLELESTRLSTGRNDAFEKIEASLRKREEYVLKRLRSMPGIEIFPREACINITIRIRGAQTDQRLAEALMKNGTLIMPCSGYGYDSRDTVMRITFAERWKKLKHSMDVLENTLAKSD